jgi:hypothetical protein
VKFYEMQTQFPEWKIMQENQHSNYIGFRMIVTCFYILSIRGPYGPNENFYKLQMVRDEE